MAHGTDRQSAENTSFLSADDIRKSINATHYKDVFDNEENLKTLFNALGATIPYDLLICALTHRSFAHENPGIPNNERLEFLGDSILGFVVTDMLFCEHPDWFEGKMSRIKAKAVSGEILADIARNALHLGPYLLLGKGEQQTNGMDRTSLLGDAMEALFAAVYLSHGMRKAAEVIRKLMAPILTRLSLEEEQPGLDWKTALTVLCHQLDKGDPEYRMEVEGESNAPTFTAHLIINDEEVCHSHSSSKRKAQLLAAQIAYTSMSEILKKKTAKKRCGKSRKK